jgi:hypothetical protein
VQPATLRLPSESEFQMNPSRRHCLIGAGACAVTPALAAPSTAVADLLLRSERGNAALMRGDVREWLVQIPLSPDFVLRSPFGGEPTRGVTPESLARLGRFFQDGDLTQEVVTTIATRDLVVLAVIERADVAVGGLPKQPWALRVTLVYRREQGAWHLILRHADPLANGITLQQAAALGQSAPADVATRS